MGIIEAMPAKLIFFFLAKETKKALKISKCKKNSGEQIIFTGHPPIIYAMCRYK